MTPEPKPRDLQLIETFLGGFFCGGLFVALLFLATGSLCH
jgi:hypothetical protein